AAAGRPRRARREAAAGLQISREVGCLAERGAGIRIERNIDLDLAQTRPLAVEHLNAAVVAVSDIDIALRVGRDGVYQIELARPLAFLAPGFHPVAIPVELGDARIHVAVADIAVAGRVPGDISRLAEAAVVMRINLLAVPGRRLVRGFLLAAKHHHHTPFGAELDNHVRALVV